ncbi:MAG: ABC transporter substrate-binding protein [Lachnospiraceae bacterium]|nr:ABC transporter substrate-binding protein [Lachnospiraceae bacterium]
MNKTSCRMGRMCGFLTIILFAALLSGCDKADSDTVTLRICNWEEYIDEGDWDEDEAIELDDGTRIIGQNSLVEDFEEWYFETYGVRVKVEYSTFGTNEELYNQITIGDVYDLVCPSEYMIMKMMREGMLEPYSEDFSDAGKAGNYYSKGVSPYIRGVFDNLSINGERLDKYAAGYMWGTLGIVYNPDEITDEEAKHWNILLNKDYYRRITIKDSVRDAYFAAIAIDYFDEITDPVIKNSPDYNRRLSEMLNRTDPDTVKEVEEILIRAKDNVYSFETDSGKADMVTGKVIANEQWSGDAVYTLDQAEEDGFMLRYSAPEEGTNLWFDGWVMLKAGISEDAAKKQAAEAFVNFLSRPENAVRNMYYIGYTSVISGGDSDVIFDYINYNYAAEDEEDAVGYDDIGYFFEDDSEDANEKYTVITTKDQTKRQLYAQYPPKSVVDRSVVMACFDDESNERINRSWTNVRCFDLKKLFGRK